MIYDQQVILNRKLALVIKDRLVILILILILIYREMEVIVIMLGEM